MLTAIENQATKTNSPATVQGRFTSVQGTSSAKKDLPRGEISGRTKRQSERTRPSTAGQLRLREITPYLAKPKEAFEWLEKSLSESVETRTLMLSKVDDRFGSPSGRTPDFQDLLHPDWPLRP